MTRSLHPACLSADQLLRDCRLERLKRSGPGGQRRNKVETAVRLTHVPTSIIAEASERRSPAANEREAVRRLRLRLAVEIRTPRVGAVPSELWQSRCRNRRLAIDPDHNDYPSLLAEALDVLAHHHWDMSAAAEQLTVTNTQLQRLLRHEPAAFRKLNDERNQRELRSMH
jgi:hypothetical protein